MFSFVDTIVSSSILSAQIATCFKLGGTQNFSSNIISANDNYTFFGAVPSKYSYISNVSSDIQNQINNKQNIGNYSTIDYVNSISSKIYLNYITSSTFNNNLAYYNLYQTSISSNLYLNYITSSTLNNNLLNYPTTTTFNNNLAYYNLYQTSISSNLYTN